MKKIFFIVLMLMCITIQVTYAADTKVSALPELAVTPDGADTLYIIDGTTSKKISVTNLLSFSVAGDFDHDDLANITGTAGQYNHPTDANMTVLGNTSGTNTGDSNQSLDNTDNPAFSTLNLTGTNSLNLGTSSSTDGQIKLKNGTNANIFTIQASVFGAALTWTLPTAVPGGANYLLNVDADGTMGYTNPGSLGGATDWSDIGDATADSVIAFADNEITELTFADTDEDMFTISGQGAYGNVSVLLVQQETGNATDGTVLEVVAADVNVDPLVVSSSGQASALVVGQGDGNVAIDADLSVTGTITGTTGIETGSSALPTLTFKDSDLLGADEEAGKIFANATTLTDGAEVTDVTITYMDAGTVTDAIIIDGSDNQVEFQINTTLQAGDIIASELASTAVTPGSYTFTALTVDQQGRITAASSGSPGAETNSLETTITGIADTEFPVGDGADSCTFVVMSGDATMANTGAVTIANNAVENVMMADNSIDSAEYVDASIDAVHLGPDADDDAIEFVIDGGGSVITTGVKGFLEVPYACTISAATLLADQSGSIVIDVWVDSYVNYPPTDADTITSATPPTITTATKSQDTTLTSWTLSLSKGDIIGFNVDSITTCERVTLSLKVDK